MGNLGLCVSSAASSQGSAKHVESCDHGPWSRQRPGHKNQLKLNYVAKLLLVDGSVLHFRKRVKVMRVLMEYPDHFVCALDSLHPGQHSLPSLLPHEELQLGHLYLLLPLYDRKSSRQHGHSNSYGMLQSSIRGRHHHDHQLQPQERKTRPNAALQASLMPKTLKSKQKQLTAADKHDIELQELLGYCDNLEGSTISSDDGGDYQLSQYGQLSRSRSSVGPSRSVHMKAVYSRVAAGDDMQTARTNYQYNHDYGSRLINSNISELPNSRHLDMQKLRRCRTWTPRLRAITETNYSTSASSSSTTRQLGVPS